MTLFPRFLAVLGLIAAATLAVPAAAATAPTFEGTIGYSALIGSDDVDAFAIGDVADANGALFELSFVGLFDLDPLGANPTGVQLNIFDRAGALVLGSNELRSSEIGAGAIATLVFLVGDGSVLQGFGPEARIVLSGLTGPDQFGVGAVDVAVFLTPIPLPAAAPMLLAGLAGLMLARRRLRRGDHGATID